MKTLKLLLTENVDNLGIVGDVVEVKPGYARNYLVPHGLATTPTEGNIKRLAARRKLVEADMKKQRVEHEAVLARLEDFELTIERSANDQGVLYGGVSQHDIGEAMRAEGFAIDDRTVRIGDQIRRLDTYPIPIVLDQDLRTVIKLWVVSDKPREELGVEGDKEGEQAEAGQTEGDAESPASTATKQAETS